MPSKLQGISQINGSETVDSEESNDQNKDDLTLLPIELPSTDRNIIATALDVALAFYTVEGYDRTELTAVRKELNADQDVYELTEDRWNLVSRCLSYDWVREEIGKQRVEFVQNKLLRWLNEAEVDVEYKGQ